MKAIALSNILIGLLPDSLSLLSNQKKLWLTVIGFLPMIRKESKQR